MQQNKRLYELDYLRAFACILVMLYHFSYRYNQLFQVDNYYSIHSLFAFKYGYLGVHIFFVLSSYLCCRTHRKIELKHEFVNRAIRLFPMYWLSIIISILTAVFLGYVELPSVFSILLNFTMIQGLLGIPGIDGVYWSLIYELLSFCYIVIIKRFVSEKRSGIVLQTIFIGMTIVEQVINSVIDFPGKGTLSLLLLNGYAVIFALGISLAYLLDNRARRKTCGFYATFVLIELIVIFYIYNTIALAFAMGVAIIIILTEIKNNKTMVHANPLIEISSASYCIYLFHNNLGQSLISLSIYKIGIPYEISVSLVAIIVVIFSYTVHKTLEIKITQSLKKVLLKL